jgi:hypothetical protein
LAVAIAVALLAGACQAGVVSSSPSSRAAAAPTTAQAPSAVPSVPPTGDGRLAAQVIGIGSYPGWTVVTPNGWTDDGHFVHKIPGPGSLLGLSVWDVGQVPRDSCHWQASLYDPGPSVDDLVSALAAQSPRQATKPTSVTLAGYPGRYLEYSVPADMTVTGDADFKGCDVQPSNGHLDFVSWRGNGKGERYEEVAGQVDRMWVLDVKGQRLVVDATYSPDTSSADRDELAQVVESLRFDAP